MGLNLPNPRSAFLPVVPEVEDKALSNYLKQLVETLEKHLAGQFDNVYSILSTGTSGTFKSSAGDTITVSNGVITALT